MRSGKDSSSLQIALFSGKIVCERCGKPYKRKVAHGKAFCQQRHGRRIELASMQALERVEVPLTEFDEALWVAMVERVTVFEGKRVVVEFKKAHLLTK